MRPVLRGRPFRKWREVPASFKQFFSLSQALSSVNVSGCRLPAEALKCVGATAMRLTDRPTDRSIDRSIPFCRACQSSSLMSSQGAVAGPGLQPQPERRVSGPERLRGNHQKANQRAHEWPPASRPGWSRNRVTRAALSFDLQLRSAGSQILEGCVAEIPNISSLDISDNGARLSLPRPLCGICGKQPCSRGFSLATTASQARLASFKNKEMALCWLFSL